MERFSTKECFLMVVLKVKRINLMLYCVKTMRAMITKSLLWAATMILVFLRQIFVLLGEGIFINKSVKEGYPSKKTIFAAVGSSSVKMVAVRRWHGA